MKGWLAANLFLFGMVLLACGLAALAFLGVRALGLPDELERIMVAVAAVGALLSTGFLARSALRLIQRCLH